MKVESVRMRDRIVEFLKRKRRQALKLRQNSFQDFEIKKIVLKYRNY